MEFPNLIILVEVPFIKGGIGGLTREELDDELTETFNVKIHTYYEKKEILSFERYYLNDGFRAYVRPFDDQGTRDLAALISMDIPKIFPEVDYNCVTFLYKIEDWELEPYKTFYKYYQFW